MRKGLGLTPTGTTVVEEKKDDENDLIRKIEAFRQRKLEEQKTEMEKAKEAGVGKGLATAAKAAGEVGTKKIEFKEKPKEAELKAPDILEMRTSISPWVTIGEEQKRITEEKKVVEDKEKAEQRKQYTPYLESQIMELDQIINEAPDYFKGQFPEQIAERMSNKFIKQAEEAKSIYDDYINGVEHGFGQGVLKGIEQMDFWNEIADDISTISVQKKLERGEELDLMDQLVIHKAQMEQFYEQTFAGKVGGFLPEAMGFMAEFWATGGAATATKTAIRKSLEKYIGARMAKGIGYVGGQAVRVVAMPQFYENMARYNAPEVSQVLSEDGETLVRKVEANENSFLEAVGKAYGMTFVEVVTEDVGLVLSKFGKTLSKTKVVEALQRSLLMRWMKQKGIKTVPQALDVIKSKVGWNGILLEIIEEEVGEPLQAIIEGREYKNPITTPEGRERLLLETVGIGLLGSGFKVGGMFTPRPEIEVKEPVDGNVIDFKNSADETIANIKIGQGVDGKYRVEGEATIANAKFQLAPQQSFETAEAAKNVGLATMAEWLEKNQPQSKADLLTWTSINEQIENAGVQPATLKGIPADLNKPKQVVAEEVEKKAKELGMTKTQVPSSLEKLHDEAVESETVEEFIKKVTGIEGLAPEKQTQAIEALKIFYEKTKSGVLQKREGEKPSEKPAEELTPELQALYEEARKYKTAEEFVKAQQPEKVTFKSALEKKDYMGGHEAPMAEDINAPIWDLTGKYTGNKLYPKDIYSSDASRLYSSGMDYDPQAISILQSVKNRPNARVTIYRAVSKDVKGEINAGDWVTLTREYAKDHGESNLGGNYKIVKREVHARDIFTDANSIQEFGYDPQPRLAPKDTPYDLLSKAYKEGKVDLHSRYQSQLIDIWEKANKEAKPTAEEKPKAPVKKKAVPGKKVKAVTPQTVFKKIVDKKSTFPALQQVRVKNGEMAMTDLEIAVELKTDLPDGMYQLIGDEFIKTALPVEEFADIPTVEGKTSFKVKASEFMEALKKANVFASKSDMRPILASVSVVIKDGKMTVVATDSYRLLKREYAAKGESEFLIPAKKISQVLSSIGEDISVAVGENSIELKGENGKITQRLIEGKYPEYEKIYPAYDEQYVMNQEDLLDMVKVLKPYLNKDTRQSTPLGIIKTDTGLKFTIYDYKLKAGKEVDVKATVKKITGKGVPDGSIIMPIQMEETKKEEAYKDTFVGLDVTYLEDTLKELGEGKVYFSVSTANPFTPLHFDNINQFMDAKGKATPVSGLGKMASYDPAYSQKTSDILKRVQKKESTEGGEFKLSERAKQILNDLGVNVAEKTYERRNLLGVYKPRPDKVRVKALYDLTTVVHEATHAIDIRSNLMDSVIANTKRGAQLRKRLTSIYTELYATGKPKHKLEKRMREGLAVLIENYFYDPVYVTEKYGDLVDTFIKPDGEYYHKDVGTLLEKMNELVDDYAKMTPEQRIGARIRTGKEIVQKESGFTVPQRIVFETVNRFEPLKRYARISGVENTWDDPIVQAFNIMAKNSVIANWVKGDTTPVLKPDGNFDIEKGSVKDYLQMIKGKEKSFERYLIARRVVADHNVLTDLKNQYAFMKESFEEVGLEPEQYPEAQAELAELQDQINKLQESIKKDDFSIQDATAVVAEYREEFSKPGELYDKINRRLIDFAINTGLLTQETGEFYKSKEGYTSFKRYIEDEIRNYVGTKSGSKSKVSSFKERHGSELDIISPIYSQIQSINEIVGKGYENVLWQKVYGLSQKNPAVAERFEEVPGLPAIDKEGNISFPQENDPNTLRIFIKGKRKFVKVAPEFIAVAKTLRPAEATGLGLLLRIPASVFTRLTTSANPFFALGNLTIDQVSKLMQTRTNAHVGDTMQGLYDMITTTPVIAQGVEALSEKTGVDLRGNESIKDYLALGGRRQTLAAYFDLSPDDITARLTGGESGLQKTASVIDSGLNILELPSNTSELITRFGEYKKSLDKGLPMSVAMYNASEVTTPFQLSGRFLGKGLEEFVRGIPYFNAALQVSYKFLRTARENPKRVATVGAAVFTTATAMAIGIMAGASDEQKRVLANLSAKELASGIYFPHWNRKDLIRIRIPEQLGAFSGTAMLYIFGAYDQNKATFDDYLSTISSVVPDQVNVLKPGEMLWSWIPQAVAPSLQVVANQKDYPELLPIVPYYMENKPPEEQYTDYTSRVAVFLGETFGLSPAKIEYWVRNQFGVGGGAVMGRLPRNPLIRSEEEYVLSGRAYNSFYETKAALDIQKDRMEKPGNDYSEAEMLEVERRIDLYSNMTDNVSVLRDLVKADVNIPENLRQKSYKLLIDLEMGENFGNLNGRVNELKAEIATFIKTQDIPEEDYTKRLGSISADGVMYEYVNKARSGKSSSSMRRAMVKELESQGLSEQKIANLEKEFKVYTEFGYSDDTVNAVLGAKNNDEKAELLLSAYESMGTSEFNKWFSRARRAGLISDDLSTKFRKAKYNK